MTNASALEKQSSEFKTHGGARSGAGRHPGVSNKACAEVREIARQWGPEAIRKAAELAGLVIDDSGKPTGQAESEQARIAALNIVLDRAYGRPGQSITANLVPDTEEFEQRLSDSIDNARKVALMLGRAVARTDQR